MDRQITPAAFYALSEDFDYRAYLEERSHSDRLVVAIDDQTAAIVGSGAQLAKRMGASAQMISGQIERSGRAIEAGLSAVTDGIAQLDRHLMEGFTVLTLELGRVGDKIDLMNDVMSEGFDLLHQDMKRNNRLLTTIVSRLETPDEVWAEEKFKAAKSQVELGNWPEALSFTTKAIEGDEHHSGYELEPSFYFLRGRIREGLIGTDLDLVDLLAAKEDFLNAVRFWPRSETWFRKQALTRAGWCCYCMGELEEAENHLVAAARFDAAVPEADYLLAKVRIRRGRTDEAEAPLKDAVKHDSFFAVQAANDGDFTGRMDLVRGWFSNARDETLADLRTWSDKQMKPDTLLRLREIETEADDPFNAGLDALIAELKGLENPLTLSECVDFDHRKKALEKERERLVERKTREIRSQTDKLLAQKVDVRIADAPEKKGLAPDDAFGYVLFGGITLGALTGLALAVFTNPDTGFTWVITLVFGVIIYGVGCTIAGAVAGAIGGWLASAVVKGQVAEAKRQRAQKKSDVYAAEHRRQDVLVKAAHEQATAMKAKLDAILEELSMQQFIWKG